MYRLVRESIPLSSLLDTSVARFFLVRAFYNLYAAFYTLLNLPSTVMELAVLLAAGLRDWIDFGVIVRQHTRVSSLLCLMPNDRLEFSCSTLLLAGIKRNRQVTSSNNSKRESP